MNRNVRQTVALVTDAPSHSSSATPGNHKVMSIRQDASIYGLVNLLRPDKPHDLELLLAQNGMTTHPGRQIESKEWCQREDARRAAALKKASIRSDWPDTSDPEDRLDLLLEEYARDDNPYDYSPASATFMREIRLKFFGAVLPLVERVASYDFAWVTASSASWELSMHQRYFDERFFDLSPSFSVTIADRWCDHRAGVSRNVFACSIRCPRAFSTTISWGLHWREAKALSISSRDHRRP
jgi:hypothetical protein